MFSSRQELSNLEMPFFGRNPNGIPMGDPCGYRDVRDIEDALNKPEECDPLVEVRGLDVLPLYYPVFTDDPSQFIREPALKQLIEYNRMLEGIDGIIVRVRDAYRHWKVQQKGFVWGVGEILKTRGEQIAKFREALAQIVTGGESGDEFVNWVSTVVHSANNFFALVRPKAHDRRVLSLSPGIPENIVHAAANFELIKGLELDPYAVTGHGSGGVVDVDFLERSKVPVNLGVPVDTAGLIGAFPFFETDAHRCPILEDQVQEGDLVKRKLFFREEAGKRDPVAVFLKETGVDVEKLLVDDAYLDRIWNDILRNRRLVCSVAEKVGMKPYGLEAWHFDCDNRLGGVEAGRGFVSGSGAMAIYLGQDSCAWGSATPLWERIVK